MSRKSIICLEIVAVSLIFSLYAQDDTDTEGKFELPSGLVVRPYSYGHFEAGQIESGSLSYLNNVNIGSTDNKIDHGWVEDAMASLGFAAKYRNHFEMAVALYTKLYFSYPQFNLQGSYFTKNVRQDVAIDDAYALYHLGDPDAPVFMAQVGYFKFKYNPDVRNLGEYLFRTGTYPIYFNTSFDFPAERLLGLHFQSNLLGSLKLDLLLTSATVTPTQGWSLSGLADYDVARLHFINIGAGVDFADLFDVYNNSSFPKYFGNSDQVGDPVTPRQNNAYYIKNGDTTYYTFSGTKIMARLAIDPKAFIKWHWLGKNDLRVYMEADLIGAKDYPDSCYLGTNASKDLYAPSYNVWWQKMPVALGINIPTYKTLDVLNFELEWFAAKYYSDASNVVNYGSAPLPRDWPNRTPTSPTYEKSQIKWSVYTKKSLFNGHFAIVGQVALDHMRLPCAAYDSESWAELLVESKDWWWTLKTSWMF